LVEEGRRRPLSAATAGIYGQILITALIAAYSDDKALSAEEILADAAITMVVFWIAHAYAAGMAWRLAAGRRLTRVDLYEVIGDEWPMLRAAIPACVVLGVGGLGVLSRDAAVYAALAVGIAGLFTWALVVGYRSGPSRFPTMVGVAISGAAGLAIVVLKVLAS
jgi:hypothetical protein